MKIINNILRVSILLLIIILNVSVNTYGDERNIKMIGHRGASALEPENTIPSFKRAASVGAWGAEADIYVLKDGNIVVFHDADVERMTNGIGEIKNMNLVEVKELNIDSLQDRRWIAREEGSGTREYLDLFFTQHKIIPKSMMILGSNLSVKEAVRNNLGLTITSRHVISEAEARNELASIKLNNDFTRSFSYIYPKELTLSKAANIFLEELKAYTSKPNS